MLFSKNEIALAAGFVALALAVVPVLAGQPAASAEEIEALPVGAAVPRLTLPAADGEPFDLNAAIASKPTVLIFYRGGW